MNFDDSNNLWIADDQNNVIRKVNKGGIINTVAGNGYLNGSGTGAFSGDGGPATAAELNRPRGIVFDTLGNYYLSDYGNNVIRKVNSSGIIRTIAGNNSYGSGYSGDGGPATLAEMNLPNEIAFDSKDNLYIADALNNTIRMVDTSGIISTVAGNGYLNGTLNGAYSGDGGPTTLAELNRPIGVALDKFDNIFIADQSNNIVRMVNKAGIINTVAGNYSYGKGYSGDGGPATIAEITAHADVKFDAIGNLYIADYGNNVIRKVDTSGIISTVVGFYPGTFGYSGNGGPPTSAELAEPTGIKFDHYGNFYIADQQNSVIREIVTCSLKATLTYQSQDTVCDKQGAIILFSSPPGGIMSGKGVWGNEFYPDSANYGRYNYITYTYDSGSCPSSITDSIYVKNCVGISEVRGKGEEVTVEPNPSEGLFTLTLPSLPPAPQGGLKQEGASFVEVYNIFGQQLYLHHQITKLSYYQIDLSGQPSGVYFYRVVADDGTAIGSGKIIIEK